jgi:pyridoxamine 5'-phosphate oxidase
MPDSASDELFSERERDAQAVAVLSKQSHEMRDEKQLLNSIKNLVASKTNIDRPNNWQAYYITVHMMEFWQGNSNRFHERLHYELCDDGWLNKKLQP